MRQTRVATRYAKSLLKLAIERDALEEAYNDMEVVANAFADNKELVVIMKSPVVNSDKKQAILKAIFEGKVSKLTLSFIHIITQKGREGSLQNIAESFVLQYKSHKKIKTAYVTSAVALDNELKDKIMGIIKGAGSTNAEVELVEHVDKDLIGGFVLRIGDKQIDSSIQHQLNKLKRSFSKNPFVKGI